MAVAATLVSSFADIRRRPAAPQVMPGGIRFDAEEDDLGFDVIEHAEVSYAFAER